MAKSALGCDRLLGWEPADSGPAAVVAAKAAGFLVVAIELTTTAKPL
ncbi:MAG: hypothetical protein R2706_12730 [Acidimicrobiales bacterium]